MQHKDYILEIIRTLYPSLKMNLKEESLNETDAFKRKLMFALSLLVGTEELEFELHVSCNRIFITSVKPYKGIIVCGPFISRPQDPLNNGFIDLSGYLTQKGSFNLFRVLKDAISIYRIVKDQPNTILELYAVYFSVMHEQDPGLRFGYVNIQVDTNLTLDLARLVLTRFGLKVYSPLDLFYSFQEIVVNHPDIFSGELN